MNDLKQMSMFNDTPPSQAETEASAHSPVAPDASFEEALDIYMVALQLSGASHHTLRAFKSDLHLLGRWAGTDTPISDFSTDLLNKFLHWMLTERGKPCSPKTYARRVTTLKNFFSYLFEEKAVTKDPAVALIQKPVSSPLPAILFEEEIDLALETSYNAMHDEKKPDARPHLLITLLLETGMKKSECMGLTINDIDRSDPSSPVIWIRYSNPRMRYKERKIRISHSWLSVLDTYIVQREIDETIFDCTPRMLEYVLRDISVAAGLERQGLSFEVLRWTSAVRDFMDGMSHDKLRQKMGLSRISWRETSNKLTQLAEQVEEHAAQQQR